MTIMQERVAYREEALRDTAERFGQGHLFAWWDSLDDAEKRSLLEQVG